MASTKQRRPCSFPLILLSCLNFTLFTLSSISLLPTILLKNPPTSLGFALLIVSSISLLSSFLGFFSNLTHFCFITHFSLLIGSSTSQLLAILALFTKEKQTLLLLKSPRDPKEAMVLVRLECGVFMAMFLLQVVVLMLTCAVHGCWVKEYEGVEDEKEVMDKKGNKNEKMNANKYEQWVKNDFEG